MLIEKNTWCFNCDKGKLTRYSTSVPSKNVELAQYLCDSCDSMKTTTLKHPYKGLIGASYYYFPNGSIKRLGK